MRCGPYWWQDFFNFLGGLQTVRCSNYGMSGDVSYCRNLVRLNEGHDNICVETSERPSDETPLRTYVEHNVVSALTMCTGTKCKTNSSFLLPCPTLQSPLSHCSESHNHFLSVLPRSFPLPFASSPLLPRTSTTSLLPTHSLAHLITRPHSTQPHPTLPTPRK